MKPKKILSILLLGLIMSAFGQKPTIELNFTAKNNGQYVPLDSILVENLTQGGDTAIFAPDTILILDYITSICNNKVIGKNTFSVSQNYPNPFKEKTEVNLYLQKPEHIIITVRDILGRELVQFVDELKRGNHSFAFYSGNEEYYLLAVIGKQTNQTIKMLNSNSTRTNGGQCKLVYLENMGNNIGYKSQDAINAFEFNIGDELKYTAYTDVEETEIINSPMGNQNYTFQFDGWTPCPGVSTVTDIDGNIYNTVQIGAQCWMKENLKTTTYRNGNPIPNLITDSAWVNTTEPHGAYCWYNNDITMKDKYGALYNWSADSFFNEEDTLCPEGWHVAKDYIVGEDGEWTELITYIGDMTHGNELKSCRQVNSPLGGSCITSGHPRWNEDITSGNYGTDDYGFSGLPGGYRHQDGSFYDLGISGYWFCHDFAGLGWVWCRNLRYNTGSVAIGDWISRKSGRSVRCIKDLD